MNSNDDIDPEVRDFILAKIDSVPQLEALLLVAAQSHETWSEQRFCRSLYIDRPTCKSLVSELTRKGWLNSNDAADGYSFDSSWDPEGAFMAKLAHAYRTRLIRVTTLIHSKASAAVRDFASAFDLKKE